MTPRERLAQAIERGEDIVVLPIGDAFKLVQQVAPVAGEQVAVRWIRTPEAEELTGHSQKKLSRMARRNLALQEAGRHVQIRVTKTSHSRKGHWLLAEEDCARYGAARNVTAAIEKMAILGLSTGRDG